MTVVKPATEIPRELYEETRADFLRALGPLAAIIPRQAFADQGNVVGFGLPQLWDGWNPRKKGAFERHMQMITHFELAASPTCISLPATIDLNALPYIGLSGKLLGIPPGGWLVYHYHPCKTEAFIMVMGEMIAVGSFPNATTQQKLLRPLGSELYYPCETGEIVQVGSPPVVVNRGNWHAAYNPSSVHWAAFLEFATQNNDATDNRFLDPRIVRDK
jgi:hypothetical protein